MLAPVRTAAPETTPVDLDAVKKHCRVDFADDDNLLAALIAAATDHLDGYAGILGRALITQTWQQDFAGFDDVMRLPLAPCQSISAVSYYDGDNAEQTLNSSIYALRADALGPYMTLAPDQSWPGTYNREDAVSITYVAGYGAAAAVPQAIKQAILLMIAHWYENRETTLVGASVADLPMGAAWLLAPYRRVGL
ncbi:MAG: hypothetical protein C0605_08005 [Hyphomicrobiales bacterium]|nr:MAG: hypothetical protein C0605_08005 [Hyphomicrobiales bacterium]